MADYWRDRELNHIKKMIKGDAIISQRIQSNQIRAMDEIQEQIDAFYGRYADIEGITMQEARKRVNKLDVEKYERKAKRYVKERNFTKLANEEMRIYNVTMSINRLELLKANIHLELLAMTSEEQQILFESMTKSARAEYVRQSGILGETIAYNQKNIEKIVNSSFLTATWSERLWDNQDALRSELDRLLNRGIIQGQNPRVLARELRKKFDSSVYNSETLLTTEMARVQQDVFLDSMGQAEIEKYEYIAEPDACPVCAALDGEIFDVQDAEIGVNAYPMHPRCKCSQAGYVEREDNSDLLPNYENAVIPEAKLTKYALDPNGAAPDKAIAFEKALGYNKGNYKDLIANVTDNLPNFEAEERGYKGYGETYQVLMKLTGPNEKTANVLTAWLADEKTGETRLTSIYVTNKDVVKWK